MARPPLLCEEGNISCISQHCQFIHTLYGRRPSLTCCLPALILLMRLRAVALALRGAPLQLHSDVRLGFFLALRRSERTYVSRTRGTGVSSKEIVDPGACAFQ